MKYTVKAYLCTNFAGLMDSLETDKFYEVQDFIQVAEIGHMPMILQRKLKNQANL